MKKTLHIIFGIIATLMLAQTAMAAEGYGIPIKPALAPFTDIQGATADQTVNLILEIIAGGLIYLAAPIAVIMIAFYGIILTFPMGEQEALDNAKKSLTRAILGLIIIIFSVLIIRSVIDALVITDEPEGQTYESGQATSSGGSSGGDQKGEAADKVSPASAIKATGGQFSQKPAPM